MVVGQIALSLMLLSAGGLFARGALKAAAANPGFSYDRQLLVAPIRGSGRIRRDARARAAREVLARVRALPGVAAVGMAARCRSAISTKGTQWSASAAPRGRTRPAVERRIASSAPTISGR